MPLNHNKFKFSLFKWLYKFCPKYCCNLRINLLLIILCNFGVERLAQIGLKSLVSDEDLETGGEVSKGKPSIIREGLKISGNIRSKSKIEVEGFIKGSITAPEIVSSHGSRIAGPVRADNLFVAGHIVGKIYAKQARFGDTSRVEGDVSYDKVVVDNGTTFDGKVSFKRLKKA